MRFLNHAESCCVIVCRTEEEFIDGIDGFCDEVSRKHYFELCKEYGQKPDPDVERVTLRNMRDE